ncbi:hypothetical protein [Nocardia phage NBR1]|uniref:hypothetical protein n=1 Tax=Nocardia phage NBR1 TaxID=1109711 RepID=UPI00023EED9B|nr:hypothetical protein NoPhNBR1_gp09 [Nocardia phage NBR1]AEV52222.1 hypothetical protein [Nocardia phage NBR1]
MATDLKYYDLETASGTVQVQLNDKDAEARGFDVKKGRATARATTAAKKAATTPNKSTTAANKADTGGVGTTSTADAGSTPADTK